MKKTIVLILALLMSLSCFSLVSFAAETDTLEHLTEVPESYVGIYTIEDLYCIRNDLTANYILMNDIDLSEATAEGGEWDYAGRGWNPIGSNDVYGASSFSGIFDGNGYLISGMKISVSTLPAGATQIYLGLFSNISGLVKNLTVDGGIYASISTTNDIYVGGVSGYCSGVIENCINRVGISVSNLYEPSSEKYIYDVYVGGISGYSKGRISECINIMNLRASVRKGYYYNSYPPKKYYSKSYLSGICGIGGTVDSCINTGNITSETTNTYADSYSSGISYNGVIKNSYNVGIITANVIKSEYSNAYAAGLGYDASCSYCYNMGLVSGVNKQMAISNKSATKCYYLASTGSDSTGATSLTQAQMKLKSMYSGWDFDTVWTMDGRGDYPYPELREVTLVLPSDPEHKHEYIAEITTPSTHIATGVMTYTCECGDTYTEDIDKIESHNYNAVITEPTCIAKGYTTYTCECGDNYVADYVDAKGHDFKSTVIVPTCTEHGYTTFTCECGENYTRDYTSAPGHRYTSQITTPATHLAEGVETYTCVCGDTYTETIAKATEHTYEAAVTAPTCTLQGYTTYTCACGDNYTETLEALGHTFDGSECVSCGYDKADECDCNCHKGGIAGLFFKIVLFFQKIFGQNQKCDCGISHY